jgi:DNA-3-methyladenine glycosylase
MDELLFLQDDAVTVAQKLIGWRFYKKGADGLVGGVIIETEAYTQEDEASHSYKGITPRNEVMFGPSGHLYVYFTYGMHYCANIVTGKEGQGEAVLLRALLPDNGIARMRTRRGHQSDSQLVNGPAKICQALDITIADNGATLDQSNFILLPPRNEQLIITASVRIGIKKDAHRLWRFVGK